MLKWLRKYNTFILVVGGCLLMVAFLLQGVLSDLSRRGFFGGTQFKIGSHKVSDENLREAGQDYNAMCTLVGGPHVLETVFMIENLDHWYMLEREAEEAGLVGGVQDGENFLDELPQDLAAVFSQMDMRYSYDNILMMEKLQISQYLKKAMSDTRLNEDGFHKALAKLRGIGRLTSGYGLAIHFGERRLIAQGKELADTVRADYVMVPAEREMAGIADPDEAAIKAHYEKYKDTPKGGGEYGIGYTLPPRVKLEWIEIPKLLIAGAVQIDDIEVEKRFLKQYPNGVVGEGKTAADERRRIEKEVREEQAAKAMATAETAVRDEIFRQTRKLERDGEFYRIPAGFETPDLRKMSETVAARLQEVYKATIPPPVVTIKSASWITDADMASLGGIGNSMLRRGPNMVRFATEVFKVKEIVGSNDLALQVNIPSADAFHDNQGNAFFFVVLDARKESTPDSMDEVRPEIVKNIKRLAAYEKLKTKESELLQTANTSGLESLTTPPPGVTDPSPVKVQEVLFNKSRTNSQDESLDTDAFRAKAMAVESALDPRVDPATVPADKRSFSYAADKSLGIAIVRIKSIMPLTEERFRAQNGLWAQRARLAEFGKNIDNPYSLENMEKRLGVKYEEGRQKDRAEKRAEKAAQKAKTAK
jgi:hypothetical protein